MINASLDWWGPAYSALKAMPSALPVWSIAGSYAPPHTPSDLDF